MNMKCPYCKDTGKYKEPINREELERLIDIEVDKGYFVNRILAEHRLVKKVGYTLVDCPYCQKKT